jgi:hypothetical protein
MWGGGEARGALDAMITGQAAQFCSMEFTVNHSDRRDLRP